MLCGPVAIDTYPVVQLDLRLHCSCGTFLLVVRWSCCSIPIRCIRLHMENRLKNKIQWLFKQKSSPVQLHHMSIMASEINANSTVCSKAFFLANNKESINTQDYRAIVQGIPPVTGGFFSQRASNVASPHYDDIIMHYDIINQNRAGDGMSTGLSLGLRPANERHRYFVTTSLIGWAQA